MPAYDALAGLHLIIEGYELEGRERSMPSFDRLTTTFHLRGAGQEGLGEDVTYDPDQQRSQQAAGPVLPLAGEWTLDTFSRHLDGLDLFGGEKPSMPAFRYSRKAGIEGFSPPKRSSPSRWRENVSSVHSPASGSTGPAACWERCWSGS